MRARSLAPTDHSTPTDPRPAADAIDTVYRREGQRVFATLIRLLGDFGLAEDALQEAFRAAVEQWPREGVPRILYLVFSEGYSACSGAAVISHCRARCDWT